MHVNVVENVVCEMAAICSMWDELTGRYQQGEHERAVQVSNNYNIAQEANHLLKRYFKLQSTIVQPVDLIGGRISTSRKMISNYVGAVSGLPPNGCVM